MGEANHRLLPALHALRVIYLPSPFRVEREEHAVPPGRSVARIVAELGAERCVVSIGGRPVERRAWATTFPPAGAEVLVRSVPTDPVTIGLFVAFTIISAAATFLTIRSFKAPKLGSGTDRGTSPALTGTRNNARQHGTVPEIFGRLRYYPDLAARPYTEVRGDDQFLHVLLCAGDGEVAWSDIRIGETPIAQFDSVRTEIREGTPTDPPRTLFKNVVLEEDLDVSLISGSVSSLASELNVESRRRSERNASRLSIDLECPEGLVRHEEDGDRRPATVEVRIRYQRIDPVTEMPTGAELVPIFLPPLGSNLSLVSPGVIRLSAETVRLIRRGLAWDVAQPGSQYDVIMTPLSATLRAKDQTGIRTVWTKLRTIVDRDPVRRKQTATLALEIKATDQLSGFLDQVNAITARRIPIWDPDDPEADPVTGFTPPRLTESPADYFVWVCIGRGNKGRVDPAKRVDLERMREWREWCADQEPPLTFNDAIDSQASVKAWLGEIAKAGRASVTRKLGRYSVIIDRPRTVAKQIAVARNIVAGSFQVRRQANEPLHGIHGRFRNKDQDWQEDQLWSYAPGYGPGTIAQSVACSVVAADQSLARVTGSFLGDGWVPGAWAAVAGRGIAGNNGLRQVRDVSALKLFLAVPPGTLVDEGTLLTDLSCQEATNTRELELRGVTDPTVVHQLQTLLLRSEVLRPETVVLDFDYEQLASEAGDLVLVQHDGLVVGQGSLRVTAITLAGSIFVTSEPIRYLPGRSYGVAYRIGSGANAGAIRHREIVNLGAGSELLVNAFFVTAADPDIHVGVLLGVGELGVETLPMTIAAVRPKPDLGAAVELVNYGGDDLYDLGDLSLVPVFETGIRLPVPVSAHRPPPPEFVFFTVRHREVGAQLWFGVLRGARGPLKASGLVASGTTARQVQVGAEGAGWTSGQWAGHDITIHGQRRTVVRAGGGGTPLVVVSPPFETIPPVGAPYQIHEVREAETVEFQARFRVSSPELGNWTMMREPASTTVFAYTTDLPGSAYEAEVRAVGREGTVSEWVSPPGTGAALLEGTRVRNVRVALTRHLGELGWVPGIRVRWDPPTDVTHVIAYEIEHRLRDDAAGGFRTHRVAPNASEFVIAPVQPGMHRIRLYTVGPNDQRSLPVTVDPDYRLASIPVLDVLRLELEGQGLDRTFDGEAAVAAWDLWSPYDDGEVAVPVSFEGTEAAFASVDPLFLDYAVEVWGAPSSNPAAAEADWIRLRRQEGLQEDRFHYTLERNRADGGPRSAFRIDVQARDIFQRGGPVRSMVVRNPAPGVAPLVQVTSRFRGLRLLVTEPDLRDPDLAGLMVWASPTSGFTPGPANLVYQGPGPVAEIVAEPRQTLYLRVAWFDRFPRAQAELAISTEFSAQATRGIELTVVSSHTVASATGTTIDVSGTPWTTNQRADLYVLMKTGDLAGSARRIASNDSNTLTLDAAWREGIVPGAGDTFDIVRPDVDEGAIVAIQLTSDTIESGQISPGAATQFVETVRATGFEIFPSGGVDTWVEVLTRSITVEKGNVNIYGLLFAEVVETNPVPVLGTPGQASPRVLYRVLRNGTPIFTSDKLSVSANGYYIVGVISRTDDPGPGTYTYSVEIIRLGKHYLEGTASRGPNTGGSDWEVIGVGTRWRFLAQAPIAGTAKFKFTSPDETERNIHVGSPTPTDTLFEVDGDPGARSSAPYIITWTSAETLTLDIRKGSYLQVAESKV